MIADHKLEEDVCDILMDVLAVEREELTPSARFFEDLGGESIDVLETSFRCEKRFGVKIQFEKVFSPESLRATDAGRLTPEALATLRAKFPFLDLEKIGADPTPMRLRELFTVDAIVACVKQKLAEAALRPPAQIRARTQAP